ncbi:MAG: molybdopterin-dependent oxidoreductase [Planctomycetes bacterium]|nr:molybdopterin-dependent oxidoreductase [Planctomycetota bacterium]
MFDSKVNRRDFIKTSTALAAAAGVAVAGFKMNSALAAEDKMYPDPLPTDSGVKIIRSACMMCNAGCGIQVKVKDGVALKIEGNPYCPHTNDYDAAGSEVVASDITDPDKYPGRICGRGNSGLMTLYDQYRVKQPLKRTGPRGTGQWQAISWAQAIDEIVNGGTLPEGSFEGLLSIRGTPDSSGRAQDKMTSSDTNYADEAKSSDASNFGFKANQYVWIRGRDQIANLTKRFNDSYGTKNHIEHSSLCNSCFASQMKFTFPGPKEAKYDYFRTELDNVEYLIVFGSNPLEANVGTPYWARKLTDFKARGGMLIVVDPFFTHTASKADRWIPIKPGTDAAMIFGMMRWMLDNGRILTDYIARPNEAAALAGGYLNWTDSSFLVEINAEGEAEKYMTATDAGADLTGTASTTLSADIASTDTTIPVASTAGFAGKGVIKIGTEAIYYGSTDATNFLSCKRAAMNTSAATGTSGATVFTPYVVRTTAGTIVPYGDETGTAELEWTGTVNGITCSTVYSLLKEEIESKTLAEWAAICEVDQNVIATVTDQFSSGSYKSCAEGYRGLFAHPNGFYGFGALHALNIFAGRVDKKGGYCRPKRYGSKEPSRPVSSGLTSGTRIDRAGSKYEGTTEEPTRQWYYIANVVSQEAIPSSAIGYPYNVKALFLYCFNPLYNVPNSEAQKAAMLSKNSLTGTYSIPFAFTSTIFMDETAAHCDYILPDTTYLERFSTPFTSYATLKTKAGTVRQPVIGLYKEITVDGVSARIYVPDGSNLNGDTFADADELLSNWTGPMPYDELLIQMANKMGIPNFGLDGMGSGKPLYTAYQFWDESFKKGDFASGLGDEGASGAPGDSAQDYMVMGGKWQDPAEIEDISNPGWAKNKYNDLICLFWEKVASAKNYLIAGHPHYKGHAIWTEAGVGMDGESLANAGYPFLLSTYKRAWHTQSRSTSNKWLLEIQKEGFVNLNSSDASSLGVVTGDMVAISSPNGNSVNGKVKVIEGLRPGVVMVDHHFGREWFGSQPYYVNGVPSGFNTSIGGGAKNNAVQASDTHETDTCVTEPISGQACFYISPVNVVKL